MSRIVTDSDDSPFTYEFASERASTCHMFMRIDSRKYRLKYATGPRRTSSVRRVAAALGKLHTIYGLKVRYVNFLGTLGTDWSPHPTSFSSELLSLIAATMACRATPDQAPVPALWEFALYGGIGIHTNRLKRYQLFRPRLFT